MMVNFNLVALIIQEIRQQSILSKNLLDWINLIKRFDFKNLYKSSRNQWILLLASFDATVLLLWSSIVQRKKCLQILIINVLRYISSSHSHHDYSQGIPRFFEDLHFVPNYILVTKILIVNKLFQKYSFPI